MSSTVKNVLSNHIGTNKTLAVALADASNQYTTYANKNPQFAPISHSLSIGYANDLWYVIMSVIMRES